MFDFQLPTPRKFYIPFREKNNSKQTESPKKEEYISSTEPDLKEAVINETETTGSSMDVLAEDNLTKTLESVSIGQ